MTNNKNSRDKVVSRINKVEGKKWLLECLSQPFQSNHAEYNLLKEGCTQ